MFRKKEYKKYKIEVSANNRTIKTATVKCATLKIAKAIAQSISEGAFPDADEIEYRIYNVSGSRFCEEHGLFLNY